MIPDSNRNFAISLDDCKFIILIFRAKTGSIKQSIDWINQDDYEITNSVLAEINFIKVMVLTSEKINSQDSEKLEE